MRGRVLNWVEDATVARARTMIGQPIRYSLAYPNGGSDPDAPDCANPGEAKQADCIGFALWAAGLDRFHPGHGVHFREAFPLYDGYINTDSMIEEARTAGKWFTELAHPEEGCFIVAESYPLHPHSAARRIGHIGVVSDISHYDGGHPSTLKVIHCSPSNYGISGGKPYYSAIAETSGVKWQDLFPKWHYIRFNRKYVLGLK